MLIGWHFNSLPHTEVDAGWNACLREIIDFNSLPHTEVDTVPTKRWNRWNYFNSLPHTEVDDTQQQDDFVEDNISTHYLTQR